MRYKFRNFGKLMAIAMVAVGAMACSDKDNTEDLPTPPDQDEPEEVQKSAKMRLDVVVEFDEYLHDMIDWTKSSVTCTDHDGSTVDITEGVSSALKYNSSFEQDRAECPERMSPGLTLNLVPKSRYTSLDSSVDLTLFAAIESHIIYSDGEASRISEDGIERMWSGYTSPPSSRELESTELGYTIYFDEEEGLWTTERDDEWW